MGKRSFGADPNDIARWNERVHGPHSAPRAPTVVSRLRGLGLECVREAGSVVVRGERWGCDVRGRLDDRWSFRLRHVDARRDVTVRPARPRRWLRAVTPLEVGDPAFDATVEVTGPEDWLRAVLDQATRRRSAAWWWRA